jgi:hypothetical protein
MCLEYTTQKYFDQTVSVKWENKPIARVRLQFRAAHSLDFMSSRLHVCGDVRHSKAPLQMRSSFRDISLVEMSVGTFSRGPFDDRLNILCHKKRSWTEMFMTVTVAKTLLKTVPVSCTYSSGSFVCACGLVTKKCSRENRFELPQHDNSKSFHYVSKQDRVLLEQNRGRTTFSIANSKRFCCATCHGTHIPQFLLRRKTVLEMLFVTTNSNFPLRNRQIELSCYVINDFGICQLKSSQKLKQFILRSCSCFSVNFLLKPRSDVSLTSIPTILRSDLRYDLRKMDNQKHGWAELWQFLWQFKKLRTDPFDRSSCGPVWPLMTEV